MMRPATAALAILLAGAAAAGEVIRPFDGRSLEGWDGDRAHWAAEDGAIVGRSTPERPLAASAYLAWQGDMPQDFELRCKVLITAGNSGIQYRSARVAGQPDMAGFQADLDAENAYTGILYEGLGRGIMSARGQQVEWSPSGPRVLAQFAPDAVLRPVMRRGEWNDYRIEARGTRVRHWINGTLMTDVTDGDASRFRSDGRLAFQLHQGPPMEVRWKDIEVRPIADAPPAAAIAVPPGFTVERMASAQPGMGSWVSIAFDPQGRAVASPQAGRPVRIALPGVTPGHAGDEPAFETLEDVPGGAQGLCFAGGALWVDSSPAGPDSGLWRLRDLDGDGRFEERTKVVAWADDGGEHGPHGVVEGPDGAIYVAVGNHTKVPEGASPGACLHRAEDLVGARMWDPRGHAVGILAPGGFVLRVDPATGRSEVFADGFRNHYDLAFNPDGELFTYDSDMEWDIGAPWYRAPRIVHVVRGGEYGWRSGSGCWPAWFPDSLPPACDTDASSPTGMLDGSGGSFPDPWRGMMFAADWTYGRILAVRLEPAGSTYSAAWQVFASGRPMPVADMAWGPDGAMYVVTGGRGTQSGIYRIAPEGQPSGTPQPGARREGSGERAARRRIEAMPAATAADAGGPEITGALASDDRFLAFAARSALERGGTDAVLGAMESPNARVRALAALALARIGGTEDVRSVVGRIAADPALRGADPGTRLAALRALQVGLARHPEARGMPAAGPTAGTVADAAAAVAARWFADRDPRIAEASLGLACMLGRPEAVNRAMARLEAAADRSDALRWATMLRTTREGWTDPLRTRYWRWLDAADDRNGGFSLRGFLERVRADAAEHVGRPPGSAMAPAAAAAAAPPAPRAAGSPLRAWTVDELTAPAPGDEDPRDLARGAQVFAESLCIRCHRFAGMGGGNGPDLTGAGARFTRRDLLRAILEPSADVSDQWRDSAVHLRDGGLVVGRIVARDAAGVTLASNPLGDERESVAAADMDRIEPVPTSSMPAGLLSARSRAEVLDLLAYLEAGGSAGTGGAPRSGSAGAAGTPAPARPGG